MGYEYFYDKGGVSSLDPEYGDLFTGYRMPQGELGATTSVQTANQIKEVTNLLNQGIKNVEVSTINPEVFESIPKQHLKEINRLNKLTGTKASLHAPVIDPSGFHQQGWDESQRVLAEQQFTEVVERGHSLDPKGNMPITIHASMIPGTTHMKDPNNPKKDLPFKMVAVNQETGQFVPLEREIIYHPIQRDKEGKAVEFKKEGEMFTPERRLRSANLTYWDDKLSQLVFYKDRGDDLIKNNEVLVRDIIPKIETGAIDPDYLLPKQKEALNAVRNAEVYLENTQQSLNNLFDQAWKYSNDDAKKLLKTAADEYREKFESANNIADRSLAIQKMINTMHGITTSSSKLVPEIYKPVEEFAKDKASETLSNVALSSYKKFGGKSPIVSIENPPYGQALAKASDLKDLVNKTRDKFVEKATTSTNHGGMGMTKTEAKAAADKLIGVTWDTSHNSMIRQQKDYDEKKLIQEAKEIAPYVKHVHFNDNFGTTHTDLPPGMASVPMKEVMEEIDKKAKGGKFKGKKVFEGGNWFQHFQTSPHPYVLEAMGSPIYGMMAAPYWNQAAWTYGGYSSGFGKMLPDQNFSTYGAGFSSLPQELGGQMPGTQSRLSGTPNT